MEGEETKNRVIEDQTKRRARMKMERFKCNGWLRITAADVDLGSVKVHFTHHLPHIQYLDITLSGAVVETVRRLKELPSAKVRRIILQNHTLVHHVTDLGDSPQGASRYRTESKANLRMLGTTEPGFVET